MNHNLKCMRRIYDTMMQDENYVPYEIKMVTIDQNKGDYTWSRADRLFLDHVIKTVKQSEPELFMLFKEHHAPPNGWPHLHGVVWWYSNRASNRHLNKHLNKKFGISSVGPSRDGKIDDIEKQYADWFEYISKDASIEQSWYLSNEIDYCDCKDKLNKFVSIV